MEHFRSLTRFLTSTKDVFISIETIPSGPALEIQSPESDPHHPFLLRDGNIGIPQSTLYKAYVVACQKLPHLTLNLARDPSSMIDDLVSTTTVLLIANPAHNTALNRRKQLIRMRPSKLAPDEDITFVAALFGSKQASKSSLLWHHRRWLFRHMYGMSFSRTDSKQRDSDSLEDTHIPIEVLSSEFKLVARASEIYPRNYHAWLHRHLCAQRLILLVKKDVPGALEILVQEVEASQRWVELHVSDYTAAQYLFHLLIVLQSLSISVPFPPSSFSSNSFRSFAASISTTYKYPVTSNALSLVASYPTHESLWLYLRLSWNALQHQNYNANRWIVDLVLALADDHSMGGHPNALVHEIHSSCRTEDLPVIRKYALRFLAWTMLLQRDALRDDVIPRILTNLELPAIYLVELCA